MSSDGGHGEVPNLPASIGLEVFLESWFQELCCLGLGTPPAW